MMLRRKNPIHISLQEAMAVDVHLLNGLSEQATYTYFSLFLNRKTTLVRTSNGPNALVSKPMIPSG